jgi:hypothetical protein
MDIQQQESTYKHVLELQAQVVGRITTAVCLQAAIHDCQTDNDPREHQSRELLRQARELLPEVEQLLDNTVPKP